MLRKTVVAASRIARWARSLRGRPARVLLAQGTVEGIARGVDEDGGLLLENGGHFEKFMSGEASLRLLAGDG